MLHHESDVEQVIECIRTGLAPLICLVIPRLAEHELLVTVSHPQSGRYISRLIQLAAIKSAEQRTAYILSIKSQFSQGDRFPAYRHSHCGTSK